ncbi:MAG: PD-(D/E)XK motif protein [Candidatus Thermoplasmatota archaeon]|nr:PD-(D/E)XK motif protein [Candidatus Thermoplasmatota archaeon]|tara:strand:+ start:337 stop:1341 length:1005 start_codon:yes stop_codon:yes gene_type:complete
MSTTTLERTLATLPVARDRSQPQIGIGCNVHIGRSPEGAIQLILSEARPPAQTLPLRRAKLESGVSFKSDTDGDLVNCVVLEFNPDVDPGAVSKVAEHLCGNGEGHRCGDDLVDSVLAFQTLLENANTGWGFTKVVGLWGELSTIIRMLIQCEDDTQRYHCIKAWKSAGIHCKDIVMPAAGLGMDVKTTSRIQRIHTITSVDQVTSSDCHEPNILSIVVRPVAEGEGHSAIDLITRIRSSLTGDAALLFEQKIRSLDLDIEVCSSHHFVERHSKPTRIFSASQVPGVSEFIPLPEGVPELSWPVHLSEGGPMGSELDVMLLYWIEKETGGGEDE